MARSAVVSGAPAERPRRKRRSLRSWIPPQHGVWAMLLLPFLAGLRFGTDWWQIPLLVGWLTGWLASHHFLVWVKTGRWSRVQRQILTFGAVCAASLIPVAFARPAVLWFVPVFAVLVGVNIVLTRMGQERSTINGIASVTMASQMALIVPVTAGLEWRVGLPLAVVTWVYLAGTVVYVKSMIREHGSVVHYRVSVGYHAVAVAGCTIWQPWLAIPFGLLLVRAVWLPRRARMKAPVIGAIETVLALVVLATELLMPL
ncbi:YwiC-like family protein [Demequina sediminicola]|uniref:YwiC-like family protein n=1 Tax=Demequina sediminicola TaxID=1095026 RepID=UPI0009E5EDFD|nr:YwiC-like family protein [Demequina sediminicola]